MPTSPLRLFNTRSEGYETAFIKLFNAVVRGYERVLVEPPDGVSLQRGLVAWKRRRDKYRRHHARVAQAERVLAKIRSWEGDRLLARTLGYLRKVDPYVFEELVLSTLEDKGILVIRNASYSGDGGLDGECAYEGRRYLIQSKRYEGAINAQHVQDFAAVIRQRRADGGLFVHTGRTPPGAYRQLGIGENITLISGQKLLDLTLGAPLKLWERT